MIFRLCLWTGLVGPWPTRWAFFLEKRITYVTISVLTQTTTYTLAETSALALRPHLPVVNQTCIQFVSKLSLKWSLKASNWGTVYFLVLIEWIFCFLFFFLSLTDKCSCGPPPGHGRCKSLLKTSLIPTSKSTLAPSPCLPITTFNR